ncbi:hypothetical protein EB118_03100 [bacterium]|nr:hypothetical protein [bacterium]NDC93952.1 hypothetical protein [bacterium]NDD83447.1 hypothetical protein [bacterium]NDG29072.1 hypothetical protein [bacterium]
MSKIVQIKIFNDILDQLFDFLEENFEYFKGDIVLSRTTVQFMRRSNPRLVVEQFMNSAKYYKEKLFNCDEHFFLDFDNFDLSAENNVLGRKIKNIWLSSEITNEQKAYIWLYFQRLYRAGEKVVM